MYQIILKSLYFMTFFDILYCFCTNFEKLGSKIGIRKKIRFFSWSKSFFEICTKRIQDMEKFIKDVTIYSKVTLFYDIFRYLVSFSYKFWKSGFKNWNQEKNLSILMVHTYMKSVSVWRLCRMSINLIGRATDIKSTASSCRSVSDRHLFFLFWEWSVGIKLTDRQKKWSVGRRPTYFWKIMPTFAPHIQLTIQCIQEINRVL